jgi:hypothetical protein
VAGLALTLCAPVWAYKVTGSFNDWPEDPPAHLMTDQGDGTHSISISGLASNERFEFKITEGTWASARPHSNSWFFSDAAGSVTLTYDTNAYDDGWQGIYRIGVSTDPGSWTAVGSWQGWDNANPGTLMLPQGNGLYTQSRSCPLAITSTRWCAPARGMQSATMAAASMLTISHSARQATFRCDSVRMCLRASPASTLFPSQVRSGCWDCSRWA